MIKKNKERITISEFRKKYINELEKNMQVAIEIRDNPKVSAKDRNEAIKNISRLLGALTPEKGDEKESLKKIDKPALKPAHKKALEEILKT